MKKEKETIENIYKVISDSQEKLLVVLDNNKKYGNTCNDDDKIEQTIGKIKQMHETSKELYEKMTCLRREIADLDTTIEKQLKEIKQTRQYSPIVCDQFYTAPLERCERFIITIRRNKEKVKLRAETVKNWHSSMKETNLQVQALQTNPCNIRLDGFQKILNDCTVKVRQQEAERDECEIMWRDHQIRTDKATEDMNETMTWLEMMTKSAPVSFQICQRKMKTEIKSSQEELSKKTMDVTHLDTELYSLALEASHLRKEMASVELMINTPSVFEVELPGHLWNKNYLKKIANVFKKMDSWNKTYEALEKVLCKYHEKSIDFKKCISQWNEIKMKSF